MLIDWSTVIAQAINFLILVWLLKRFLYKPILQAIDERDKRIATQSRMRRRKRRCEEGCDDFQHKNQVFDKERSALLKQAINEAKVEHQRLWTKHGRMLTRFGQTPGGVRKEQRNLSDAITRWMQKEVFAIARKRWRTSPARAGGTHGRGVRPSPPRVDRRNQGQLATALDTANPGRASNGRPAAGAGCGDTTEDERILLG